MYYKDLFANEQTQSCVQINSELELLMRCPAGPVWAADPIKRSADRERAWEEWWVVRGWGGDNKAL